MELTVRQEAVASLLATVEELQTSLFNWTSGACDVYTAITHTGWSLGSNSGISSVLCHVHSTVVNYCCNFWTYYTHLGLLTQIITGLFLFFFLMIICKVGHMEDNKCRKIRKRGQIVDDETLLELCNTAKVAYDSDKARFLIKYISSSKQHIDVNKPLTNSGLSLFLCSCFSGHRRLIQFLLDRGADAHQTTPDGDTVLYLATFGILNSGHSPEHSQLSLINDLVKAGCGINVQNCSGHTPLHRAAGRGNIAVIKCLLANGADPSITTNDGIYPIDFATNAGHFEAAELLAIQLKDDHVWDIVEPHTPQRVRLGLASPRRNHLCLSPPPSSLRHSLLART